MVRSRASKARFVDCMVCMLFGMSCGTKASSEWCPEIFSHLFALAQLGFRLERAEGLAFARVPSERDSSWRGSGGAMIGNTSTE